MVRDKNIVPLRLNVFDITGRLVKTLVRGTVQPGYHEIPWYASQYASGVIQISSNDPDEGEMELQLVGNYEGGIVGVEAQDFTLPVVANGSGSFTLSDYAGKIVVIAFFAPG